MHPCAISQINKGKVHSSFWKKTWWECVPKIAFLTEEQNITCSRECTEEIYIAYVYEYVICTDIYCSKWYCFIPSCIFFWAVENADNYRLPIFWMKPRVVYLVNKLYDWARLLIIVEASSCYFWRVCVAINIWKSWLNILYNTVHSPTDAHLLKLWLKFTLKLDGSYMFWSTTIMSLRFSLAKVILILKHSVTLCHYLLCSGVAACCHTTA